MSATPRQRATRRDAGENLDTLLDAAARVLADDPAATMAEIAAASGLGRVTAWRHLGSREQLLALLSARAASEVREMLERLFDDTPVAPADIGRAVEALVGIGTRYRVLFITQPGGPLQEHRRTAFEPLARAIRRGQRAGTLRRGTAPDLAAALTGFAATAALEEAAGDARALKRTMAGARQFAEAALRPTPS